MRAADTIAAGRMWSVCLRPSGMTRGGAGGEVREARGAGVLRTGADLAAAVSEASAAEPDAAASVAAATSAEAAARAAAEPAADTDRQEMNEFGTEKKAAPRASDLV